MTVNIAIITHDNVGSAILNTTLKILGTLPLPTTCVPINHDLDPDCMLQKIRAAIENLQNEDGILVLTDLFGATPNNLVRSLQDEMKVKIVTGINLPMLIRVMNYSQLCLTKLAEKAISGGKDGVVNCAEVETLQ